MVTIRPGPRNARGFYLVYSKPAEKKQKKAPLTRRPKGRHKKAPLTRQAGLRPAARRADMKKPR